MKTFLNILVFSLCVATTLSFVMPRFIETTRDLWRKFRSLSVHMQISVALGVALSVGIGGSKETNYFFYSGSPFGVTYLNNPTFGMEGAAILEEDPVTSPDERRAGYVITEILTNSTPLWVDASAETNLVFPLEWNTNSLARTDDTIWINPSGWSAVVDLIGTTRVDSLYWDTRTALGFNNPAPGITHTNPSTAGSFIGSLWGSHSFIPSLGSRAFIKLTDSNAVFGLDEIFVGRDTNQPASVQALYSIPRWNQSRGNDIAVTYLLSSNAVASGVLTNYAAVLGNQAGLEYLEFGTNTPSSFTLMFTGFGYNPVTDTNSPGYAISDMDNDGLTDDEELFTYKSDMWNSDTDYDGIPDREELILGSEIALRDTDLDGIPDGSEAPGRVNISDAGAAGDLDGDGLPDSWENYWLGGTEVTGSPAGDYNSNGAGDYADLLTGTDPAFSCCAVVTSRGVHRFSWSEIPDATVYHAYVINGDTTNCIYSGDECAVIRTNDYSDAEYTLKITASCPTNAPKQYYTASETFRQPDPVESPNLTVFKITDPFAMENCSSGTVALTRTFTVNRSRDWGGFYVSSDFQGASGWELENLVIEISGDASSMSTNASPENDSLPLDVFADAEEITVTLRTTVSNALCLCRTPLYLLDWSPELTISTNANITADEDGHTLVIVSDLEWGDSGVGFTVDTGGRPSNTPLTQAELYSLSRPFGGSMAVTIIADANGLITGGYFRAGAAGLYSLQGPSGGGGDAMSGGATQSSAENGDGIRDLDLLLINPSLTYRDDNNDNSYCECSSTSATNSYPFTTACLRKQWLYSLQGDTSVNPCLEEASSGVEVHLGLDEQALAALDVKVNGIAGTVYTWQGEENYATAEIIFNGRVIWTATLERQDPTDRCRNYGEEGPSPDITVEDDGCGCSDGCAGGDCSANDGPDFGSLRFRVSLGAAGYGSTGGFIWFSSATFPSSVTPQLFNVTAAPSVNVFTNEAGFIEIDNAHPGGRRITLSSITDGVRLTLERYDEDENLSSDGSWDVTKSGGVVSFIYTNASSEIARSLSYTFVDNGGFRVWMETDNLTDGIRKYKETDYSGGSIYERRLEKQDAEGNILDGTVNQYCTVGSGTAAVERVKSQTDLGGLGGTTYYYYYEDNLNPYINGKLKLVNRADGGHEFHQWDVSGRETLRVVSKEGSGLPTAVWQALSASGFSPSGNYPDLNAVVTVYSYATHDGDDNDWRDAGNPRTVTEYRVANGSPVVLTRTWHIYTRGTVNVDVYNLATATHTAIRAASQTSVIDDAANRTSVETSFLDSYCGRIILDGRPLFRLDEDGSAVTWDYEFYNTNDVDVIGVTTYEGTETLPVGIAGESTYQQEEICVSNGLTTLRQEFLYTGGASDPVLGSETSHYDGKGRLVFTEYADGTIMSNYWSCCKLLQTTERDGSVRMYEEETGSSQHSSEGVISQGDLPGAGGYFTVTASYTDEAGRETNSVRSVCSVVGEKISLNTAYAQQVTTTEYPLHKSNFRVTTDHLGVATTNRVYLLTQNSVSYIVEETIRAGVKTTVKTAVNGEAETTVEWTDPVSGDALKKAEKWVAEILENGWEKRTSYVKYDDGEWLAQSETVKDMLGRIITSSRAGTGGTMLTTSNVYNNAGLLVQTVNHDGSSVVYDYNELNERVATIRVGAGQTLDFDPLNFTLSGVIALDKYLIDQATEVTENSEGKWWRNSSTVSYRPGENALTTSVQRVQLTGLTTECNSKAVSIDVDGNTTETTESLNPANATKIVTTINTTLGLTNLSYSVTGYETCSSNSLGEVTEHRYDGFARRVETADYANGRGLDSVTTYHDDGSVATIGEVTATGTNTTSYSTRQSVEGKLDDYKITVTDPQGNQTVNYYSSDGQLYRSEGATYPNETARDSAGRMSELHTWRDENGDSDVTCWYYDPFTGAVTNKLYADGNGTFYSYLADGRISSREWARGLTTTYGYTDTTIGSIGTTEYSDDTPSVTNTYNLAGQLLKVEDGSGTTTFGYDFRCRQIAETNALATITRSYDSYGRYMQFILDPVYPEYPCFIVQYSYDIYNRLETITAIVGAETNTFTYSYLTGTQLITGYTVSTPSTNLTIQRSYEPYRNLISAITNSVGSVPSVVSSFTYSNDNTGKRTARIDDYNGSTTTNTFDYNVRGEVTNAVMNSSEQSITFDDIGNRTTSTVNSVSSVYTANQLNQYTSVNSAGSARNIVHDLDGNLTYDGSEWHHTYNAENRLISSTPNTVTNGTIMLEYAYNYRNLRVEKVRKQLSGREAGYPMYPGADPGTWNAIETRQYVWDGYNIAAEIIIDHVTPSTNISYYTWGIDLSGSLQGAGGVGGLLSDTKVSSTVINTFYAFGDANGNITEYIDDTGTVKAHYEYSVTGEETYKSGSMKDDFTHRYSTKPFDKETGLVQYQRRPYDPVFNRLLSRDPMGEWGGINIYGIAGNDLINKWDYLGMWPWEGCCNGNKYNKLTKCCCDKGEVRDGASGREVLKKKKIKTGIRSCEISSWQSSRHGGSGWPHAWLEVDGFSAGFGPGLDGNGQVKINDKREGGDCKPIELSPCEYNISLVKEKIIQLARADVYSPPKYSPPTYWCYTWRDAIIEIGKKKGKNKCGK